MAALSVVAAPPGYAIVQAHIFFRHGDRCPTRNILDQWTNAPSPLGKAEKARADAEKAYWESTLPRQARLRALNTIFPVTFTDPDQGPSILERSRKLHPFGILTKKGLSQSEALGAALRRQYVEHAKLLPGSTMTCQTEGSVLARSTAMERTVQSCQGFLRGFCGVAAKVDTPQSAQDREVKGSYAVSSRDDGSRVNVLVETGGHALLPNFGFIRERCPSLMEKYSLMMSTSEDIKRDDAGIKKLIERLAVNYPSMRSPLTPFQSMSIRAFDHFKCHSAHKLPTAKGTERALEPLKSWASSHFYRYYSMHHGLMTSFLLRSVVSQMKRLAVYNDPSAPKVCLYSGHDTTIMPLLLSLGVVKSETAGDEAKWPAYSAHVRLELLRKINAEDQFSVRIVYDGKTFSPTDGGEAGAEEVRCVELSEFESYLNSLVDEHGDLDAACKVSTSAISQNPFQDAR